MERIKGNQSVQCVNVYKSILLPIIVVRGEGLSVRQVEPYYWREE